jgi:Ni/Fe-hydrogenase 1 B-type cytochrome subunit
MQSVAYSGLFFMIFLIVITGLILMGAGYHVGFTAFFYTILKPVENMLGGLAIVRYIHHILTWLFILFIVVHVYMAFWYDAILKQGTVSSMISGWLFEKEKK